MLVQFFDDECAVGTAKTARGQIPAAARQRAQCEHDKKTTNADKNAARQRTWWRLRNLGSVGKFSDGHRIFIRSRDLSLQPPAARATRQLRVWESSMSFRANLSAPT